MINKSVLSLLRRLSMWCCLHLLLSAVLQHLAAEHRHLLHGTHSTHTQRSTDTSCLQGTQQQTCYMLLLLLIDCTHRQIEEWADKWPTVTQTLLRILRRQSEQSRYFVNIFKCQTQQYKAISITNETVHQQIITATIMEKCVKLVGLCAWVTFKLMINTSLPTPDYTARQCKQVQTSHVIQLGQWAAES